MQFYILEMMQVMVFNIVVFFIIFALVYLLGEIFFYLLINFSTAEVTDKKLSVRLFHSLKVFSVDLSNIKLLSTSKDLEAVRSLGYRASRVVKNKNLLVIIYERNLFGLPIFPKQEFEQVVIAKNSVKIIDDLEKLIPEATYRPRASN